MKQGYGIKIYLITKFNPSLYSSLIPSKTFVIINLFLGLALTSNGNHQHISNDFQGYTNIETTLEGIVQNPDGTGIEGIKIVISKEEGTISKTSTDKYGFFSFKHIAIGDKIKLKLKGDKGTGIILIEGSRNNTFLELEYPVLTEVVILHDNDQHFDFNYTDQIKEKIESIRTQYSNVYHFNAGDIFVKHSDRWGHPDNPQWYKSQAFSIISKMNKLGYNAITVGNHELQPQSTHTLKALTKAEFPY